MSSATVYRWLRIVAVVLAVFLMLQRIAKGGTSTATVGAGFARNIVQITHTGNTVTAPGLANGTSRVLKQRSRSKTDAGAFSAWSTDGHYTVSKSSGGAVTHNIPFPSTRMSGWDYGNVSRTHTVEREWIDSGTFANDPAGTGVRYGFVSDVTVWTYNPALTGPSESHTYVNEVIAVVVGSSQPLPDLVLDYSYHNGGSTSHTWALKINGVQVQTGNVPAASVSGNTSTPAIGQGTLTIEDIQNGDTYQWIVDGVGSAVQTVAYSEPFPLIVNGLPLEMVWTAGIGNTGETPKPIVTTETPPPTTENPSPAPQTTIKQETTFAANPAGDAITKQDIYAAFRQALLDAGASSAGGTGGASSGAATFTDGDWEDPTDALGTAVGDMSSSRNGVVSTLQTLTGTNMLQGLPTSLGTGPSGFDIFQIAGTTARVDFNSPAAVSIFTTMRACALFVLNILFALGCVYTVRRYV